LESIRTIDEFRIALVKTVPIALFPLALIAILISHQVDSTSGLLSNLATSGFFESFWSLIFAILAFISWKRPGEWFRTAAWLGGFVAYGVFITIYMIQMFSSAGNTGEQIATHDLVAFGLVLVVWVSGIAWAIQSLILSISAGDWNKTIWAKRRANGSGKLN
jgi:hypothetical protein